MCGGGGGGGNDAVKYQRKQDDKRAQAIAQGKTQLERIFAGLEGDEYRTVNPVAKYSQPEWQRAVQNALNGNIDSYTETYQKRKNRFHNAHPEGPSPYYVTAHRTKERLNSAGREALKALGLSDDQIGATSADSYMDYYQSAAKAPGSYQRVEDVKDPIWEQQQKAYVDYATPQLEDQYSDARERLVFALSRQGQMSGSLAGDRYADLAKDYQLQKQQIVDTGRGYANKARQNIADQKQSLLSMLNATADAGATAEAARAAVNSLQATPSFSALGPLFQNATAGLGSYITNQQNQQQQQQFNNIVYGGDPDKGTGKVLGR